MPKATTTDISLTKSYIPKVSKIPSISPTIAQFYKPIENRNIHEGRVVDQAYYKSNNIERLFTNIRFNCLFQINEPIVPRFILDFYSQVTYSQETEGPYCTNLFTPDNIRRLLELERVVVYRTIKSQMVSLNPNQILTKELSPDMKQREELIRENVFGLGGHRDRLPTCLAHMLYCVVAEEQYNLAYFLVKRIQCARATPTVNLSYGMFLTRLYRHVMETHPHLDNGIYDIVERVMRPLALKQTRRLIVIVDPGTSFPSLLHPPAQHQGTYLLNLDDDGDDDDVENFSSKHPTAIQHLFHNGYLNPPNLILLRVSPPPPTQENASMDTTLTFSPITLLDVQFNTPSPLPPIVGHPIPWNLLEAHGDSCLCCIHNRTLIFGLRDELQYMFSYIEHMLSQPPTTIIPPPPPSSPN
ncbi:hypothetical protein Tco_0637512 [Tanacetum coccineum]